MEKPLIAYFSREGKNYVDKRMRSLTIGNTEIVARKIQELTSGDLLKIETISAYPDDYTQTIKITKEETRNNARPAIRSFKSDAHDLIYLGFPIWWGTMPMPVFSFLEAWECAAQAIAPFCTHEGSGLGRSIRDIKGLCPNVKVLPGLAIKGGNVYNADGDIVNWVNKLKLL